MTALAARFSADPLRKYLPPDLRDVEVTDTFIPSLARDARLTSQIRSAVRQIPTNHELHECDSRRMKFLRPGSIHLVVTSPPYWTLKKYRDHEAQLGHVADYDSFLESLDAVWKQCYDSLVPGGRVVIVVGDVCLSRRKNNGRHTVIPLHASIQERCRKLGFDNLAPIIWHKISNANYEVEGNGGFLGKPYEPNAVIKNDVEFILMQRKSGGYRSPSPATRALSVISEVEHRQWFQQIWSGITGASTRSHPAPYPLELAERLVRMFSFAGDTILDPFLGSGTTTVAAGNWGRNSIGVELDPVYFDMACTRIHNEVRHLFDVANVKLFPRSGGR